MDDFIDKVAWGLNLVFRNGVGYPRTSWLVRGGAKDELAFKDYLRVHQVPTRVWYSAYGTADRAQHPAERAHPRRASRRRRRRSGCSRCDARPRRHPGALRPRLRRPEGGRVPAARDRGRGRRPALARRDGRRDHERRDAAGRARAQPRLHEPRPRAAGPAGRGAGDVLERVRRRDDDTAPVAHPRRPRRERARAVGVGQPERPQIDARPPALRARRRRPRAARGGADARARGRRARASPPARDVDLDDFEPFGFRDGISQPFVEGLSKTGPPETTVRAGEFVLGYPNEYGLYTDRPLLDASADPGGTLPRDAEGSGRADLGRNGSYLVFRQLRQDVPGFWRYVDDATRRPDGSSDPEARLRLASKMVGRWPSGAPLTLAPDADDPSLADANDFAYHELDPRGARCPVGSHIRRSHPRDSLDPRPGSERLLGDQPPPPHPPARPRVRHVADDRRGARRRRHDRARPELHLPEREHPAPVRVHQPHLAEQPEVRRALRRRRSRRRAVGARSAGRSRSRPTASASA